jgi:hypothetical protein
MDPLTLAMLASAGTQLAGGLLAKKPEPQMKGDPKDFIPGGKFNPGWEGVTPNMSGVFSQMMQPPDGPATIGGLEPGMIGQALGPLFTQMADGAATSPASLPWNQGPGHYAGPGISMARLMGR